MAPEVARSEAGGFLRKSEEFLEAARENLERERYDVAAFEAIQAMINANDALTTHFLGKRASADHREALLLHADVVRVVNDPAGRSALKEALDQRSEVGYLARPTSRRDAEALVRKAIEFRAFVVRHVSAR